MMLDFFDAHTHAQFTVYDTDREAVIARAVKAGVGMVNVGTKADTSEAAIVLAGKYKNLWATIGLHPTHASGSDFHDTQESNIKSAVAGETFDYDFYKKLALDPKVVAIGECGLDYFRLDDENKKQKQKELFIKQIELAYEVKKPLMIHCRAAFEDLVGVLNDHIRSLNTPPGIIHFFGGTKEDAVRLLAMGFYFTFGGVVTFARAYDEVIKEMPLDRILSETDAPYVAPVPYRGERNEPAYVIRVVEKLAEIKSIPVEEMRRQILKNTENCFNLKVF